MKRIRKQKLSDFVSEAIIEYIQDNQLKPGDKLPTEFELAQNLGIGRTSVREGVRQLEAIGLLTSRQGEGVYLKEVTLDSVFAIKSKFPLAGFLSLSAKEILDLMAMRIHLEVEACRLAVQHIGPKELENLKRLLESMTRNLPNPEEFIKFDMQFHKQIAVSSGNVILSRVFGLIEELFWRQQQITATLPGARDRALEYHKAIYTALLYKDAELAFLTMRKHLENTQEAFKDRLNGKPAGDAEIPPEGNTPGEPTAGLAGIGR